MYSMSFWPTSTTRCQINNYLINRIKDRRMWGQTLPRARPFRLCGRRFCYLEKKQLLTSGLSMGLRPKS